MSDLEIIARLSPRQLQILREELARIDWTAAEYATPRPAGSVHYGHVARAPIPDVPQFVETTIRVRSRPPAIYYTIEGNPIPFDEWVTVPISPGIMEAIKTGDLEEQPGSEERSTSTSRARDRALQPQPSPPTPKLPE